MKTTHTFLFVLVLLLLSTGAAYTQTVFLEEGFENGGSIPTGWTQVKKTGDAVWTYINGGEVPPGGETGLPPGAHSGSYNASFYKSSYSTHETFLISPEFSFEFAQKPELRFWYAQYLDQLPDSTGEGVPNNNKFKIYYRSPQEGNTWFLLKELNDPTEGWVFDSLPIADSITNKKYTQVQLGFLGISSTVGFGSCIDDIQLIETDTVTKYIEKIYASQPNLDIIPSGSNNNPILRLRFPVQGNDGALILDSLTVTALEQAGAVVAPNGVKLYHTTTEYFTNTTPIGTPQSFVGGKAIFNNINHELPFGNSYVWVTYDIPEDTQHEFKNVKVDAKIEANSIKVNNALFPLSELSPSGYRLINESIFFDDFESDKGWSIVEEFQRATPIGEGGFYQNPDPTYAKSGVTVLGTDLTGLGAHHGDYEPGLSPNQYQALTPTFDCSYFKELNIQYYRWLNVNFGDTAGIDYSLDGGLTWTRFWQSSGLIAESEWSFKQLSLSNLIDRSPSVTLRFILGPTGASQYLSGWNIDNFALTGTFVNEDIGVSQVLDLSSGCGHVAPEPLKVVVNNYGYDATNDTLPIKYSRNNGATWVHDTVFRSIPQGDTIHFTFSNLVDFTAPGEHTVLVSSNLTGDEDSRNNSTSTSIYVSPTYTLPFFEDFEANNGYWRSFGDNESWEHGAPTGSLLNKSFSGTKCWATNLDGNYPDNDSAWIESPCFDFTGIDKPIIDFMLWAGAEPANDGLALYYSLDEGSSWNLVPAEGSYDWNWYNQPAVASLGHAGWDSVGNTWFKARQILPNDVANHDLVKFRFVFASNDTIATNGFGIDDIRLYNAPADAGVTALASPVTSCYLSEKEELSITVKNFGIRPITAADTLFATLIINDEHTYTDTFYVGSPLAVNATANFSFSDSVNMFRKKWYHIEAYTRMKGDTAYYTAGVYNDTLRDSVYVMGEPLYSIGPDIGTYNADTIILDGGVHSAGGANFIHYNWIYEGRPDSTSTIIDDRYFGVPPFPTGEDYLTFTITVENDSGCFAYDTLLITKSQVDIGITAITGITDACINGQNQNLEVTVTNHTSGGSSYTMPQDTTITVAYMLDGTAEEPTIVTESFNLLADLLPGASVNYTFDSLPVYPTDGTFTFTAYTVVNADLDYSNDTMTQTVSIYPLPEVELGADSLISMQADTLMLDAGAGFDTYTWNGVAGTQTYAIPDKATAWYKVVVSDTNSCGTAVDSLLIISDNWQLLSIDNPTTQCEPSASEQMTITLKNKSPNTYTTGYQLPATIELNEMVINEAITLPADLAPGESLAYTFSPVFDLSAIGTYTLKARLKPVHDSTRNDNQLSATVNIWGVKDVEIGPDTIITQRADTLLFDAGLGFQTYNWQNGSTESSFNVTEQTSTRYWVEVTDFNGCPSSRDTVQIISYDLALEELVSPEPKCDINSISNISFNLVNNGPDVIPTGQKIYFNYYLNSETPTVYEYTLSSNLFPFQSKLVSINETFDLDPQQSYTFTVFADWEKDYFNSNDTLHSNIYQLEHPTVELGNDIFTTQADTVSFSIPTGYTTYYWQDGSRNSTFDVTKTYTANYWVEVRNAYGCTDADTLRIYTYDIAIASFDNLNACEVSAANTVTLNLQIIGQDTLYAGQEIEASYTFDGTTVNETITLDHTFDNLAYYPYTFTTPFAVSDTGNYSITASISMVDEVNTTNNGAAANFRTGPYLVTLPEDIVTYESSEIIDAGSNFGAYAWSNGASTQSIEVTEPGTYTVTTTDVNGCESSDAISIKFLNPAYDVVSITGLADSCTRDVTQSIAVQLRNNGNDTIYTDSVITLQYKINSEPTVQEPYTFVADFEPGNELLIPFATPLDLRNTGSYTVTAFLTIGGRTSSIDTVVHTFGLPQIDMPADTSTYANSLVLDAGNGFESYLWNTGELTQTNEITEDGSYTVTVTNANNCSNTATTQVLFIKPQYNIIEILGLADGCENTNSENLSFVLRNDGNDIIYADSTLTIVYQINENNPVAEQYTFVANLEPEQEVTIPFASPLNLSSVGSYEIQVWIPFGQSTSEADTTINTWGYPEVNLGPDKESIADSELLNAGEGFATYLWSTGATSQTIEVSTNGSYWVEVANTHGCTDRDTISLIFHPIKLEIFQYTSPLLGCGSLNDEVKMVVKNTGLKEVAANTEISLGYQFDNNERVNETTQFANAMQPNANLSWTFDELLEEETPGTYTIKLFVGLEGNDLDTAEYELTIFEEPVFFDGQDTIEVATYPYELNPNVTATSYEWNTGATSSTISVSEDGKYTLTITQDNTCTYEGSVVVEKTTGIADAWGEQIKVYPVPVEKELRIKIPEHYGVVSIQLNDINGKLLYYNKKAQLDELISFENWEQGVYLLRISNNEKTISYQLIKQ
jgi:hypothetical protein